MLHLTLVVNMVINFSECTITTMKKIGLVIQGALTSVGRTGDNMRQSVEQLKKEGGVVEYDCRENINRIIREFGHLFDEIVVSVFDNQLKPGDNFPGAKIVSEPDPGGIKQVGHYKDNNKYRQFISTFNGLKELEKSGVDYAIKTRTDIYLDFEKLISSFFKEIKKKENPEAIGATVTHLKTFLLHDPGTQSLCRPLPQRLSRAPVSRDTRCLLGSCSCVRYPQRPDFCGG